MTAPHGHRYALMVCYKKAGDDSIGYHAWQFHHTKPWRRISKTRRPSSWPVLAFSLQDIPSGRK